MPDQPPAADPARTSLHEIVAILRVCRTSTRAPGVSWPT